MSGQPITNVEDAVAALGALPMPSGPVPQPLSVEQERAIRSLDLLALVDDRAAPVISGHLAALLGEVDRLRVERHSTNESLDDAAKALRAARDRIAELEALTPAAIQTCRVCGAGYSYGQSCSTCVFRAQMAAELQVRGLEGEHYSATHHSYTVSHDRPELGGA